MTCEHKPGSNERSSWDCKGVKRSDICSHECQDNEWKWWEKWAPWDFLAQSWVPPNLPHWLFPLCCPHQGICMLSPKEDLPWPAWHKRAALVWLGLIRAPPFTADHEVPCSAPGAPPALGPRWGWRGDGKGKGGCGEQHCFSCVLAHMDVHISHPLPRAGDVWICEHEEDRSIWNPSPCPLLKVVMQNGGEV